jgi:hypothetical protein
MGTDLATRSGALCLTHQKTNGDRNVFKLIAAGCSAAKKSELFAGTARRVHPIDTNQEQAWPIRRLPKKNSGQWCHT